MDSTLPVIWTNRSLQNAQDIIKYLLSKFSAKEAIIFEILLREFEQTVSHFPDIYPKSKYHKNLRKAVIHKNTSVFYVVKEERIIVVAMQDNRQEKSTD